MIIPKKEVQIVDTLIDSGFDAFVVGGAVRDLLLNKPCNDVDIATNALPDEIETVLNPVVKKISLVGKSFGVIIADDVEVATFREDDYSASNFSGHKDVSVKFVRNINTDLSRRDFTMNAIALDLKKVKFIDPHNGILDIENKIVRFVGDPSKRIKEDPNRILRAFRFACTLGFTIEKESWKAICDNIESVKIISPERIRKELIKTLSVEKVSVFFNLMKDSGALKIIFPEFQKSVNHEHGIHHKENVWDHAMLVGDAISCRFPLVKLAGYFHDIGKPESYGYDKEKGKWHFRKHHTIGASIIRRVLERLTFSNYEVEKISGLVRNHMAGYRTSNKFNKKTVRKILKKFYGSNVEVNEFLRIRIADKKGNTASDNLSISEIKQYIIEFKHVEIPPFTVNFLDIKGGELITLFSLKPGPIVGELQRFLLNEVIEGEPNEYNNLVDIASKWLYNKRKS